MKSYLTEFIGTFFLVVTLGLILASQDPFGGLVFGAVLMVMTYAGAHVSGAHFNPAVTLAVWLRGRMEMAEALTYMAVQLVGAIAGALVGMALLDGTFQPAPGGGEAGLPALLAEFLFTFALAYVVLNTTTADETAGNAYFGLAIGFTLVAGYYAAYLLSGGIFNPAVALGPMVVDSLLGNGSFGNAWLYLVGPLAGGAAAAFTFKAQH